MNKSEISLKHYTFLPTDEVPRRRKEEEEKAETVK
jgi:hypothetical protein